VPNIAQHASIGGDISASTLPALLIDFTLFVADFISVVPFFAW
jgi:hypothetical protein